MAARAIVFLVWTLLSFTCSFSQNEWESWKQLHGKKYIDEVEESNRFMVWKSNREYINDHNSVERSYVLKLNEFADLTNAEFVSIYNGFLYKDQVQKSNNVSYYKPPKYSDKPPITVDWRTKNVVTPVKNQGNCGSCWAFATTGSLEAQHAKKTGKLVSLSEQQLMDCSGGDKYDNHGCQGGKMTSAFVYIKDNGGDDTEKSYPYKAENGTCKFNSSTVGATDTGYVKIPQGDEEVLMDAVYRVGPVSAAMDASVNDFRFYHSGVYLNYGCSPFALDHGVLVVGYGVFNGAPYWLVKNSWGTKWGMDGYFMLARFIGDMCGIATDASYPTV